MGTTKGATAIVHSTREQNIFDITTTPQQAPQPHPPTIHPPSTENTYTQHNTHRSDIGELVDVFKSMLNQTNNSASNSATKK